MVWPIQQRLPNNQQFMNRGYPANNLNPMIYRNLPQQSGRGLFSPERIGGLNQKLNNVQQVLRVVQSAAPIIQQYGPIVKNIPTMYKLMKAFNQSDDADDNQDSGIEEEDYEGGEGEAANNAEAAFETDNQTNNDNTGESTPKLFI